MKAIAAIAVLFCILALVSMCCVLPVAYGLGCDPDLPGQIDAQCAGGGMFNFAKNSLFAAVGP